MYAETIAVLDTFEACMMKAHKKHIFMSAEKALVLLGHYHDVVISRRTYFRILRWLEDRGYIQRIQRIKRLPDGTLQGLAVIIRFGPSMWSKMKNRLRRYAFFFKSTEVPNLAPINSFQSSLYRRGRLSRRKKPPPRPKRAAEVPEGCLSPEENRRRLRELLKTIG